MNQLGLRIFQAFGFLTLLFAPIASACAGTPAPQLVITYRCNPPDRPAFRDYLEQTLEPQLARWNAGGQVATHLLLFNPYVSRTTWDAMMILDFANVAQLEFWRATERKAPGGLIEQGAKLAHVVASDLGWQLGKGSAPSTKFGPDSVCVVATEQFDSKAEYPDYLDGALAPRLRALTTAGALARFRIHRIGDIDAAPTTLLLLQYSDLSSSLQRDAIAAPILDRLKATDPAWAAADRLSTLRRNPSPAILADVISTP